MTNVRDTVPLLSAPPNEPVVLTEAKAKILAICVAISLACPLYRRRPRKLPELLVGPAAFQLPTPRICRKPISPELPIMLILRT